MKNIKRFDWKFSVLVSAIILFSPWSLKASSLIFLNEQGIQEKSFKEISGIVKTEYGDPIPGVAVLKVGTNEGTETDIEGNYSLNAEEGDKLQFVIEGFKTVIITVRQGNVLNITLIEDSVDLSDIVVDKYRTVSKEIIGCAGIVDPRVIDDYVEEQNVVSTITVTPENFRCTFPNRNNLTQILLEQARILDSLTESVKMNEFIDQVVGLEITTENNISKAQTILKEVETLTRNGNYAYIVDGVRVSEEVFRSLNPSAIESVDIYRHTDVTNALYGNKENQSRIVLRE